MEDNNTTVKPNLKLFITVFITTFKIGCVTFGGGMAMIPVFSHEFALKRNWVSESDISDITAVAQTLPGIVALNVSVLTAYRVGGTLVAIFAGMGVILPSFIILCVVTVFYTAFVDNPYIRGALRGVSGAVVALFISALYKMFRQNLAGLHSVIFFIISAVLIFVFPSLNVVFIIIGGGICGFILNWCVLKRRGIKPGE